jgi:hypothetical protein
MREEATAKVQSIAQHPLADKRKLGTLKRRLLKDNIGLTVGQLLHPSRIAG